MLFSYIMSIRPNSYYIKRGNSKLNILLTRLLFLFTLLFSPLFTMINSINGESRFEHDVIQIFTPLSINLFWIIGVILLVALLMAVTICYKSAKPIRSFIG